MIPTAIIGFIISTVLAFVLTVDTSLELFFVMHGYYPIVWLIICAFFKNHFDEPVFAAAFVTSPVYIGLIGLLIGVYDFSVKYTLFGITVSLLIFEYKIIKEIIEG